MVRKHGWIIFSAIYFLWGFVILFDIITGKKSISNPLLACIAVFGLGIGWTSVHIIDRREQIKLRKNENGDKAMLEKYGPLLQSLIYIIFALLLAITSKGIFVYIFYVVAGILLLIALWQSTSLVEEFRKRGNTRDSDS